MKNNEKVKICLTGGSSTFIRNDFKILNKYYDLKKISPPKKWLDYLRVIPQLIKTVRKCDVTYSWFADFFSAFVVFFSKKFGKKSIVVVGGYDASYEPEINYGAFTKLKSEVPARYVLKNADLLIPVSNFTKNEVLKRTRPKEIKVVYNGIDIKKIKSSVKKEKIITTIGQATKKSTKVKGLETFARVSTYFPDYKFIIIGQYDKTTFDDLKKINKNLIFTGEIPHDEVIKWLQRSKIYCQLSYIESFGIGVAEAMFCKCIPVTTKRGGLAEVVGDVGFFVPYGDIKVTTNAIKKALELPKESNEKARDQSKKFNIKNREEELIEIILKIME